jgi:membrane protease YdiL (CAAX protease family)
MLVTSDHILAFIIVVAWPLYAAMVQFPRLKRGLALEVPGIRVRAYLQAMLTQWVLAALALVMWTRLGRPAGDLGFGFVGGWRLAVGVLVLIAAVVFFEVQRRRVTRSEDAQRQLRKKIGESSALLPGDFKELFLFTHLSVTAGVCEEILYRGFLIWYLTQLVGLVPAVILSSVFFGFAHLYQGRKGIAQTGAVGLVFALLYVVTGALWVPMLLHTVVDINSGVLWFQIGGSAGGGSGSEPSEQEEGGRDVR